MSDTIQLPAGQGFVQTNDHHDNDRDAKWFQFEAIKNSQIETARAIGEIRNHVTVESHSVKALVEAHTRHTENLIRDMETRQQAAALADAKNEVFRLRLAPNNSPTATIATA